MSVEQLEDERVLVWPDRAGEGAKDGSDDPITWQEDALCPEIDLEAHNPEPHGSTVLAKKICALCTVRSECLAAALVYGEETGVWGGLDSGERKNLMDTASSFGAEEAEGLG